MNKTALSTAVGLALGLASLTTYAATVTNTEYLTIMTGAPVVTNIAGNSVVTSATGSYFGMDTNGDSKIQLSEPLTRSSSRTEASFPFDHTDLARCRSSRFCLRADLVDQVEGAALLGSGHGEDLEGRSVLAGLWRAAGVAHDGGQVFEQALEAVSRRAVIEHMGRGLGQGSG